MTAINPETWWDDRLTDKSTFDFFVENLGNANMPSRIAARELGQAHPRVRSVLDVGCGPAIDKWHDTGIHWTGIDSSLVLASYSYTRGITIDTGSADKLPYNDGTFDLVYSRHVWEHLPHFKPALVEACRVARVGVIITFFRPPGLHENIRVTDGAHYNDYRLTDIIREFDIAWPRAQFVERRLAPQKFLPDGEVILAVWKK